MKPQAKPITDTGTPELRRKCRIQPMMVVGVMRVRNMDSTEIDRMLIDGRITPDEHGALSMLQDDLHKANMIGPRAQDYARPFGNPVAPDASLRDIQALRKASVIIQKLIDLIGRHGCDVVVNLCIADKKVPVTHLSDIKLAASQLPLWRG